MSVRWIFALSVALTLGASGTTIAKRKPLPKPKKLLPVAKGPITLELEAVDLEAAKVTVLIGGVARPPAARLFALHDDRDRHVIALDAHCTPATTTAEPTKTPTPKAPTKIRCVLDLPRPYLTAHIRGMTVHLRNREIAAEPSTVAAMFKVGSQPAHEVDTPPADMADQVNAPTP